MNPPYGLVIFDCDGVVVDSERLTNIIIRNDLATRGLDLALEQVMEIFVGGTMQSVMEMSKTMGARLPDTWLDDIYKEIYAILAARVELVPGIVPVLDGLVAAGIPYAMGSNGSMQKMQITLGRTGLLDRFQGRMYSGQEMDNPKPAPDVFLKAAKDAGVAPENCAVVEDSASGARAAWLAGMDCYGYCADGTASERLITYCRSLFDDMIFLPRLLGV